MEKTSSSIRFLTNLLLARETLLTNSVHTPYTSDRHCSSPWRYTPGFRDIPEAAESLDRSRYDRRPLENEARREKERGKR